MGLIAAEASRNMVAEQRRRQIAPFGNIVQSGAKLGQVLKCTHALARTAAAGHRTAADACLWVLIPTPKL